MSESEMVLWCHPYTEEQLDSYGYWMRNFTTKYGTYYQTGLGDYYITTKFAGGGYSHRIALALDGRLKYITCKSYSSALALLRCLDENTVAERPALGCGK